MRIFSVRALPVGYKTVKWINLQQFAMLSTPDHSGAKILGLIVRILTVGAVPGWSRGHVRLSKH